MKQAVVGGKTKFARLKYKGKPVITVADLKKPRITPHILMGRQRPSGQGVIELDMRYKVNKEFVRR